MSPAEETASILKQLGVDAVGGDLTSRSPIDGSEIGSVRTGDAAGAAAAATKAFEQWRTVPAPRRGELVRLLGEELRAA